MIVYHGSIAIVQKPSLSRGRTNLDFGQGFYTTPSFVQAQEWATRRAAKFGGFAIVSEYSLDESGLNIKQFPSADNDWLDWVISHRTGKAMLHKCDIVVGEIADDYVYDSIALYLRGVWSKQRLLKEIRTRQRKRQVCLVTEKALSNLLFIKEHKL